MNKFAFDPQIDLPVAASILIAFLWHFHSWSRRDDVETQVDLVARLRKAQVRVTALCVVVVAICWTLNFAVWGLVLLMIGGAAIAMLLVVGDAGDGMVGLTIAAFAVREWSFGFPLIVLHPPKKREPISQNIEIDESFVAINGVAVSALRPLGEAKFDDKVVSVVSDDGQFIRPGTAIRVTVAQKGRIRVAPAEAIPVADTPPPK